MKVYMVTSGSYSDYGVVGVFSTIENAQQFIDRKSASREKYVDKDFNGIDELELDEPLAQQDFTEYVCRIYIDNGWLLTEDSNVRFGVPESRTGTFYNSGRTVAIGFSAESKEHARKLAAERRQEELRNKMASGGVVE